MNISIQIQKNVQKTAKSGENMAERTEKIRLTREYIATALILLLEEKAYDNISITDISDKAGVSRMTYYRNYNDKDDILVDYFLELGDYFIAEHLIGTEGLTLHSVMEKMASFFKANLSLISAINKANLSYRLTEELINLLLKWIPEVKTNTFSQYSSSFYVGGILATFRFWCASGMNESPDEIADMICGKVNETVTAAFEEIINNR